MKRWAIVCSAGSNKSPASATVFLTRAAFLASVVLAICPARQSAEGDGAAVAADAMFQLSTARRFDLEDLPPETIDRDGVARGQSGTYWSHPTDVSAHRFVGAGEETSIWCAIPTSPISGAAKNA